MRQLSEAFSRSNVSICQISEAFSRSNVPINLNEAGARLPSVRTLR
jgi:hypothetical protein